MKIALDFDEVLFPFLQPFLTWLNPRLPEAIVPSEATNYDLAAFMSREDANSFVNEFYNSTNIMQVLPERFAVAGVKSLLHNHDVFIVTGRSQQSALRTRDQLNQHFPELKIHFCNQYRADHRNKAEMCKELGADVLVDDQVPHINEAIELGIHGVFVTRPWKYTTTLTDKAAVADSWNEILGAVMHYCHT